MEQSLDGAQAEASGPQADLLSPLEEFILDEVEPHRDGLNSWGTVKSHTKLLIDAARGRRLRPQRIGFSNTSTFALSQSGKQVGGIYGDVTTLVSHQALRATDSQELSRHCLVLSHVPHLAAKTFHVSQAKSAAHFLERLGKPVSVRPSSPKVRSGVSANLTTVDQLALAWACAAKACSKLTVATQQIEVEPFLPWVPLRVFVVGEAAVAAVARVPLYVMGDGTKTLGQLAEQELQSRTSCAFLDPLHGLKPSKLLAALALDPNAVLDSGQLQLLTFDRSGQEGPGWSVDVTGQLKSELTDIAINAVWAFPGLGAAAVDMLTPSLTSAQNTVVARVEPGADLREFRYPAFGSSQVPNRAIMDRIAAG